MKELLSELRFMLFLIKYAGHLSNINMITFAIYTSWVFRRNHVASSVPTYVHMYPCTSPIQYIIQWYNFVKLRTKMSVRTVRKFNINIVVSNRKSTPLSRIYDRSLYMLGTSASLKSGEVKLA